MKRGGENFTGTPFLRYHIYLIVSDNKLGDAIVLECDASFQHNSDSDEGSGAEDDVDDNPLGLKSPGRWLFEKIEMMAWTRLVCGISVQLCHTFSLVRPLHNATWAP